MSMFIAVDKENKEYFSESHPGFWLALGSVLFSLWSFGIFTGIKDFSTCIFFLIFFIPNVWFVYSFLSVVSCKKAPINSQSRIDWVKRKHSRYLSFMSFYDNSFGVILNPIWNLSQSIFKMIALIALVSIGVIVFSFLFGLVASLSIHSLLLVIIWLMIIK